MQGERHLDGSGKRQRNPGNFMDKLAQSQFISDFIPPFFWYGPAAADNAEVGACGCRRAVGIASHVDRQENGSDEIASAPENCKCGACQIHDAIREIVMLKAS